MKVNSENISATLAYIESTWKSIESQKPFEYYFLDEKIDRQYKAEKQAGMIFSLFSLLAILIACLGLFGLASFIIESRSKEIGVRKVLGATIPSIILLLSKDFMKWVILANIIACPIAFMVMNKWLQNFAYRIDIEPWIFILSSVLTLMIAQITISYQSIKAAMTNPVEPLKYE